MAAFDTTRPAYVSVTVAGQLSRFIVSLMTKVISWNDSRMTRNTLSSLSDRELEDIGLIRGDIDKVANRH